MQIRLDYHSRVPIYRQIVNQVKEQVARGVLRPGDQLPTVRGMAKELDVNFNTIARAYRLLHGERVISTQQGRGTYVREQPAWDGFDVERHARLMDMVDGWLAQASQQGFRPTEVAQALRLSFSTWTDRSNHQEEQG